LFYIYFPFLHHYFQLWQRSWGWALEDVSCIGVEPAVVAGAFYLALFVSVANGTGEVGTFLFEGTPLAFAQMDQNVWDMLFALYFELKHLPYRHLILIY